MLTVTRTSRRIRIPISTATAKKTRKKTRCGRRRVGDAAHSHERQLAGGDGMGDSDGVGAVLHLDDDDFVLAVAQPVADRAARDDAGAADDRDCERVGTGAERGKDVDGLARVEAPAHCARRVDRYRDLSRCRCGVGRDEVAGLHHSPAATGATTTAPINDAGRVKARARPAPAGRWIARWRGRRRPPWSRSAAAGWRPHSARPRRRPGERR